MNEEISQAQRYLRRIDELNREESELKEKNKYLPVQYNNPEIEKSIQQLTEKINELEQKISAARAKLETTDTESKDHILYSLTELDEILSHMEELILRRKNFEKYKNINDEKKRVLSEICASVTSARDLYYQEVYNDSLENSNSLEEFINGKCLLSQKLRVPFMVALLTHDPGEIYQEVINYTSALNTEQKDIIRSYIESQKRRIEQNLVLSDVSLINLLETNTGKNILKQENINSRSLNEKRYYRYIANKLCRSIPTLGRNLTICLTRQDSHTIINAINNMARNLPDFTSLSSSQKVKLFEHIKYTENNLQQEIWSENHDASIAISQQSQGENYDILRGRKDRYSLDGSTIKRFSENGEFLRTIDDMQISSFPINTIENFVGESFRSPKVPIEIKQQIIATVLDNLQLCYNMFQSYYMSGNGNIKSYITLSNGLDDPIELNQPLNNDNIHHLLGIPPTHKKDKDGNIIGLNLPKNTLKILDLDANISVPARVVLKRILERKEMIVKECGCYQGNDGIYYELLPWEKIILKTNAFIRGDFFKTTSLIGRINSDAYMISPNEKINAFAINSTLYSESPVHQKNPNITSGDIRSALLSGENLLGGRNSLYQRNKDMVIKGLISQLKNESYGQRISRISGVVTNESFIGERMKTSNGSTLKTMNQPAYLLQSLDPTSAGLIVDVVNANGIRSTKSLDENILLLEDLVLTFGDIQPIVNLAYEIIEQLKQAYNYSNGRRRTH